MFPTAYLDPSSLPPAIGFAVFLAIAWWLVVRSFFGRTVPGKESPGYGTTIPIGSAPQGGGQMTGFAWPANVFRTMDGFPAVFYRLTITNVSGDDSPSCVIDHQFVTTTPFFLADQNGCALLFPDKSWTLSRVANTLRGTMLNDLQKRRILNHLRVCNLSVGVAPARLFGADVRFREEYVLPGTQLEVSGFLDRNLVDERFRPMEGLERFLIHATFQKKHARENLRTLDLNRDGAVSAAEWQAAYSRTATGDTAGFTRSGIDTGIRSVGVIKSTPEFGVAFADRYHGVEANFPFFLQAFFLLFLTVPLSCTLYAILSCFFGH